MSGCPWALNPFVENTTVQAPAVTRVGGRTSQGAGLEACGRGPGTRDQAPITRAVSARVRSLCQPHGLPLLALRPREPRSCAFLAPRSLVLTETLTAATY